MAKAWMIMTLKVEIIVYDLPIAIIREMPLVYSLTHSMELRQHREGRQEFPATTHHHLGPLARTYN